MQVVNAFQPREVAVRNGMLVSGYKTARLYRNAAPKRSPLLNESKGGLAHVGELAT